MEPTAQFFKSIKAGNLAEVKQMLHSTPKLINARDEKGISACMTAVYSHHEEIVNELLMTGFQPNFWEATAIGRSSWVAELLNHDETLLDKYSADGFTALGLAAFFGKKDVLEILVSRGADVNLPAKNPMQVRPIHSAVAHNNPVVALQMAELLIENGADLNVAQAGGWTPLHQAAAHGQVEMVKLLLLFDADKNARSDDGRTPLDMARQGQHESVVELLA